MNDWGKSVLEQYDVEVRSTRKGRGALLCETNQGLMIPSRIHGINTAYGRGKQSIKFSVRQRRNECGRLH